MPFHEKGPDELLGLAPGRTRVATDHEGFGWGRVPLLVLEESDGRAHTVAGPLTGSPPVVLSDALVIALHVADEDGTAPDDDPDVELRVGDEVLVARLSAFMRVWGPRLPVCATWVLALCNPARRTIARPPTLPEGAALWYGLGDVDSWVEDDDEAEDRRYGLTAEQWRRA